MIGSEDSVASIGPNCYIRTCSNANKRSGVGLVSPFNLPEKEGLVKGVACETSVGLFQYSTLDFVLSLGSCVCVDPLVTQPDLSLNTV